MILVVSSRHDGHARAVLRRLDARGAEATLLDLSDFPQRAALAVSAAPGRRPSFELRSRGRALDLRACRAVWWHRPERFALPEAAGEGVSRSFAYQECHEAFAGVWHALDPLWVNDPVRHELASRKTHQLDVATAAGLAVPRTLVTNDQKRARAFVRSCGRAGAVVKLLAGLPTRWHPTRRATADDPALATLAWTPAIFQEYVAGVDVRVTIVGRRTFAMEVDARRTDAPEDFRVDWAAGRAHARPARLPAELVARLRDVMDRLGIVYGAFDLRRRDDGAHVFLEVNPGGQWLFVEDATGLPITDALADLLARGDRAAVTRARPRS